MMTSDSYLNKANQIWKMLDDMAASDPKSYREFIEKQTEEAKVFYSKPSSVICLRTGINSSNINVFINICSWARVPVQEKPSDSMPVTGGKLIDIDNNSKIAVVAFNKASLSDIKIGMKNFQSSELLLLALDVVESQNEGIILNRSFKLLESEFYGNFEDIIEKAFPGSLKHGIGDSMGLPKEMVNSLQLDPQRLLQAVQSQKEIPCSESNVDDRIHVLPNTNANQNLKSKPLIEEVSSTADVTERKPIDSSSEVTVTCDSSPTNKELVINVKLPDTWKSPLLTDCFIKTNNVMTIFVTCENKVTRRMKIDLPYNVDDKSASARFNKKKHLLKIATVRLE